MIKLIWIVILMLFSLTTKCQDYRVLEPGDYYPLFISKKVLVNGDSTDLALAWVKEIDPYKYEIYIGPRLKVDKFLFEAKLSLFYPLIKFEYQAINKRYIITISEECEFPETLIGPLFYACIFKEYLRIKKE